MENKFDLDPETAWSKIAPQLDRHFREKRRKRFMWWLFFVTGVSISVWLGYQYYQPESTTKIQIAGGNKTSGVISTSPIVENAKSIAAKPAAFPVLRNASSAIPLAENNAKQKNKIKTNSVSRTASSQEMALENTAISSANNQKIATTSVAKDAIIPAGLELALDKTELHNDAVEADRLAAVLHSDEPSNTSDSNTIKDVTTESTVNDSTTIAKVFTDTAPVMAATSIDTTHNQIIPLLLLPSRSWHVGLYAGTYRSTKSLTSSAAAWVDRRRSEEHSSANFSLGMDVSTTKSNWMMGAGFELAGYGERTDYLPFSYRELIDSTLLWSYLYDATDTFYVSGNQVFQSDLTPNLIDSVSSTLTDTLIRFDIDPAVASKNGNTRWTYVELPVIVGYKFQRGKWAVAVTGAVVPGLLTQSSGYYLKQDESGILAMEKLARTNRFMLSARAGLGVEYTLANRWTLHLDPQWRKQLFSVYDDNTINQRYSALGATLGVRMKLK